MAAQESGANTPPPPAKPLAYEIAALDTARSALRARQPARALAAVDDYARRFPRGVLAQEATVVRIEALTALGNRAEAERLGRSFLALHPGSPLAQRVRSVLDSVIDSPRAND
jgi:outer membrane protein assembly factor BamD (BamD/ComL family)